MKNLRLDQINKMIELSEKRMDMIMKRPLEQKDISEWEAKVAQKELELQVKLFDIVVEMEEKKARSKTNPEDEARRKRSRLKVEKK